MRLATHNNDDDVIIRSICKRAKHEKETGPKIHIDIGKIEEKKRELAFCKSAQNSKNEIVHIISDK